jgi:putative membrane protein
VSEPGTSPARLHPATLLSRSLKLVPQFALGGAGYAAVVEQQGLGRVLTVAGFAIGLGIVLTLLSWWRFTWRVAPGEIVIEQGVLKRQRRVIPFDRVQDISIEQGLLYRLFGTARVRIETGGSASDEGDLDSIALADANRMRDIVRGWNRGAASAATAGAEEPVLFLMSLRRVFLSGLFNFSLVFLAILFGAVQYLEAITGLDIYDPRRWAVPAEAAAAAATVQITLLLLLLLWAAGMVAGVLRTLATDYGFKLTRSEAGLRRRRGLFTLSEVVIPIRRMQVAAIDSGLLMRALGWSRLSFQTLGADRKEGGLQVAAPFARMEEALPILAEPGFPTPPPRAAFIGMPKRALLRRTAGPLALSALAAVAAVGVETTLALPAALLFVLAVTAALRLRKHHYAVGEEALFVSGGLLSRRLWIVPFEKLQTLSVTRSVLQRKLRLATLVVDTAGASALHYPSIVDLDAAEAKALAERLLGRFRARRASLREAAARGVCEGDQREHHWHLDQHADDSGQSGAAAQPEQTDRNRDGELEEVRRSDQGARGSDREGHAPRPGGGVGDPENGVGLDEDRGGDQRDQ